VTTSYIDYIIDLYGTLEKPLLLISPEVSLETIQERYGELPEIDEVDVIQGIDIVDYISKRKLEDEFRRYSNVFASRVIEHIPIRNLDWYIFNIYQVMQKDGKFIIIVPNMTEVCKELEKEWNSDNIDLFRINRLNHELFSEGPNVWDRHCLFTNEKSIKYMFEKEGLFKLDTCTRIKLDSNIVPDELHFVFTRT
jgi:predicted SAM-dependent methyltransferase